MKKTQVQLLGLSLSLILLVGATLLYQRVRQSIPPVSPGPGRVPASEQLVAESLAVRCNHIYSIVCTNRPDVSDPTGSVRPDVEGEKQALKLYHEIIKSHPDWDSDQVDEELVRQIYSPTRTDQVKTSFLWVKNIVENFILLQTQLKPEEKEKMHELINRIQLQLPPPATVYGDELDLFTKNEVYYERTEDHQLRLRVGGAYLLIAKSWFNLVFTLAHEIAHSIDPCEVRNFGYAFPAYQKLKSCFVENGLIASVGLDQECGPQDQFSEVFADWIAVQVTAQALKSRATLYGPKQLLNAARNSVRDLCRQEGDLDTLDTRLHATPEVRIEKIFGTNPDIRRYLGCEALSPRLNCVW